MKKLLLLLPMLFISANLFGASKEGVPVYYQNLPVNNVYYRGNSTPNNVVVARNTSYGQSQYRYNNQTDFTSSKWNLEETGWALGADVGRRYADFTFETGVLSKLSWTNMIFNEIGVNLAKTFDLGDYPIQLKADYRHGTMADSGDSYDDDLRTNPLDPYASLYTISVGKSEGKTDSFRLAVGAKDIWNLGGWKLTPYIGYEIFQHDLKMKDHRYPNQGVNIPALTQNGNYIFTDGDGTFYSGTEATDTYPYQVCLSPEDLPIFTNFTGTTTTLNQTTWVSTPPDYPPWGVSADQCVVIGGDGEILVDGITHIYNTTWSGFFVALGLEKQFSINDKLSAYAQIGVPYYESDGIWPNRTDWQQDPSFTDKGSGGFSYKLEAEYTYAFSPSLKLSIKVDTDYYRKGKTEGTLYAAGYWDYTYDSDGIPETDCSSGTCYYVMEYKNPESIHDPDALKWAEWQSFGLHIGLKTIF